MDRRIVGSAPWNRWFFASGPCFLRQTNRFLRLRVGRSDSSADLDSSVDLDPGTLAECPRTNLDPLLLRLDPLLLRLEVAVEVGLALDLKCDEVRRKNRRNSR